MKLTNYRDENEIFKLLDMLELFKKKPTIQKI